MTLEPLLDEAKDKVESVSGLANRVVIAYDEEDLLSALKGVKGYPAAGIVYEGMRAVPESKPTSNVGTSAEVVIAVIIIQQADGVIASHQKKTVVMDLLRASMDKFLGQRSTVTKHYWKFLVEAPAELSKGMVVWTQRWSVPIQLSPVAPPS